MPGPVPEASWPRSSRHARHTRGRPGQAISARARCSAGRRRCAVCSRQHAPPRRGRSGRLCRGEAAVWARCSARCAAAAAATPFATSVRNSMRSASVCGRCAASRYTGLSPMVSATAIAFPSGLAHTWPSPGRGAIVALARMAVPDLVVFLVFAATAQRRCPPSFSTSPSGPPKQETCARCTQRTMRPTPTPSGTN